MTASARGPPPTMAVRRSKRPRRVMAVTATDSARRSSMSDVRPTTYQAASQTRERLSPILAKNTAASVMRNTSDQPATIPEPVGHERAQRRHRVGADRLEHEDRHHGQGDEGRDVDG